MSMKIKLIEAKRKPNFTSQVKSHAKRGDVEERLTKERLEFVWLEKLTEEGKSD